MAGIGFELKKIMNTNSIASVIKASVSGIFIVAGPWIFSIISLSVISYITHSRPKIMMEDFFSVLVYVFSISIIISGGFQYIVIRIFSDFIYEDQINKAFYIIRKYMYYSGIIAFLLTIVFALILSPQLKGNLLLLLIISLLTSIINMLWVILIFVSYLKLYKEIAMAFILGIIFIALGLFSVKAININIILSLYAGGNLITLIGLYFLSKYKYPPQIVSLYSFNKSIDSHFGSLRYLFFTGILYYLYIWIDKILYWHFGGVETGSLGLKLLYNYDFSLYIANLSIIPGLLYFIINSETVFAIKIKKFTISLTHGDYKTIKHQKYLLRKMANSVILKQSLNQFLFSLSSSLIMYYLFPEIKYIMFISFWAVYFQLVVFSYLNFLFYLDRYIFSFIVALFLFLINFILFFSFQNFPFNIPGLSYLVSNIIGVIFTVIMFNYTVRRLDRYIFSENDY